MSKNKELLIALGANLPSRAGSPAETLEAALVQLRQNGFEVVRTSRFFETPCFPAGAGPDYVNAAAVVSFDGSAGDVLSILHAVEAVFDRERVQRWGQRTLDLDLIAAGDEVLPDRATYLDWLELPAQDQRRAAPDQLILPHPRVQDRAFVLVPLADVAPDWRHPVLGQTVLEMLEKLGKTDVAGVRPI